ncbi:hypothetical protein [Streptomyces sp. NPDC004726]
MSDGDALILRKDQYRAVMQWALRDYGPMDCSTQIQVGELIGPAGWFVDHAGFGARRFGDKRAAWTVIRRLMDLHEGRWEQVPVDRRPFYTVRRSDGSRVLYSQADGDSLFGHWGRLRDQYWDLYGKAHQAGTRLRTTQRHGPSGFSVTQYTDPLDGSVRYWLDMVRGDADWRVVDYTGRALAEKRYEQCVENSASDRYPYRNSDVDGVPVSRKAPEHPGMRRLPSGVYVAEADLPEYEKLYGPLPRRRGDR